MTNGAKISLATPAHPEQRAQPASSKDPRPRWPYRGAFDKLRLSGRGGCFCNVEEKALASGSDPLAANLGWRHDAGMDKVSSLAAPKLRKELCHYLGELAAGDPRTIWQQERQEGISSGIDEVFHFFFDDHDFHEGDIGVVFLDPEEAAAVGAVKRALDALLKVVGDKSDDDFIEHRLWVNVTAAASAAQDLLAA